MMSYYDIVPKMYNHDNETNNKVFIEKTQQMADFYNKVLLVRRS